MTTPPFSDSDRDRLAAGDLGPLGPLYRAHAAVVRRLALKLTGDAATADDLTQDTFLALIQAAHRFDGRVAVRAYLLGITSKLALRRQRRVATLSRILHHELTLPTPAPEPTPEGRALLREMAQHYQQALDQLSPAKRDAVWMADVEGLTGPEIAKALSVPIGTVWTRLHHARAELRRPSTTRRCCSSTG